MIKVAPSFWQRLLGDDARYLCGSWIFVLLNYMLLKTALFSGICVVFLVAWRTNKLAISQFEHILNNCISYRIIVSQKGYE